MRVGKEREPLKLGRMGVCNWASDTAGIKKEEEIDDMKK